MSIQARKILFFVTEDWFFCSHFLERAVAARAAGFEVLVLTHAGSDLERIAKAGVRPIPLQMDRRSINPVAAFLTLCRVMAVYRTERPVLVHHIALKPILLGSLAARSLGIRHIVNAVVGMGYAFTSTRVLARILRPILTYSLKLLLNPPGSRVVFENGDDLRAFVASGQVRSETAVLIRGAGVDPGAFRTTRPMASSPVVVLVARMLWDKGIGEFVEAARILKSAGTDARFVLIGDVDTGNRAAIERSTLQLWREQGIVEWWGFRSDIPTVLELADIACLPSYREGLPKSLLEAMAAGLACVTTDVPGCREAVRNEDNGLLVPARDAKALASALKRLIADPELRMRMGRRGRERVENEFSTQQVVSQTLSLYEEMLGVAAH